MSRELIEHLRGETGDDWEYDHKLRVMPEDYLIEAADLIDRQSKIIDEIDSAWVQFVNCWGDPTGDDAYDEAETKKNLTRMGDCLRRARALTNKDDGTPNI